MTRRVLTLAAVTAAAVICVLWALAALAAHHAINPGHTQNPRTANVTAPGDYQVRFDWATGVRAWGGCVHPKHPDEPLSYSGWHEWARRHSKTHKQHPCPTLGCPILVWDDEPGETA